jgi:hypothetical protein
MAAKKVSKTTLSMFLRTRCDKELYLSLHDKKTMGAIGLPEPVKRPGIGLLSVQGKDFELERNDQLVRLFGPSIIFNKSGNSYNDIDLAAALAKCIGPISVLLQAKFSIARHKTQTLKNIGLSPADIAIVPDIADFIPDVLVVREAKSGDMEILPDGSRRIISDLIDARKGIEIFDIKHTSEANPSYCAEIALYALMLANWIEERPEFKSKFYVTLSAYLWTRFKQGDSELERLQALAVKPTPDKIFDALLSDSEDANLRFYLAAVRRFFDDVVRVVKVGDLSPKGWEKLEWHVSGTCGSCDWLGDKRHLSRSAHIHIDSNPSNYCIPCARMTGHLSLIPGITRGAKKILQSHSLADATAFSTAVGHPALQEHTVLKREARTWPMRTTAVLTSTVSNDANSVIASLAGFANLQIFASINFDSSAGLLTGLALSGFATAYKAGQAPTRFQTIPFIVDQKTLGDEWIALEGFLSHIADCIQRAEAVVAPKALTGQIHFWEERQFKELCNALGRHLPRVLALSDRKAKALAWVFPPDDFIATPESLEASTVVTIDDIIRRMVFTPTPHVITLFDTAEVYSAGPIQTVRDSYYREYLSNGIPRERIYELWSHAAQIKRGTTLLPRNSAIAEYADALSKQSKALESICERLRKDYRGQFKAKATHIPTSIPQGARSVAFDAKLWIWWDSLEFNTAQLESHIKLSMEGERLEASYEAIVMTNGRVISPNRYEFDVAPSSTEAKFKVDSMLTLGKIGRPGMPLEHAKDLLSPSAPYFQGDPNLLGMPLWSVLGTKLIQFDRVTAKAIVEFSCYQDPALTSYLFGNSTIGLLNDVFLMENKSPSGFDWTRISTKILKEIGNPSVAVADNNAANAMGIKPNARKGGTGPITPVARLLWEAPAMEATSRIPTTDARSIALFAQLFNGLNASQTAAVEHAAERALTIIWGPPGTGKTNTLAAFLHGVTNDANTRGRPLKVLVTGPTYKAVEEIMHRAMSFIKADVSSSCQMFMAYSAQRAQVTPPHGLPPHISYKHIGLDLSDPDCQGCLYEIKNSSGVVIVGTQIRQARRFPEWLHSSTVQPVFDIVVIDESSQVPVSHALSAMCGLKSDGRLVVAGDRLQMPPITSLDAPTDAAYLVGSIQTYLVERFVPNTAQCILETNYRSAEDIVAFARTIGYPPTLSAAFPNTSVWYFSDPAPSFPSHLPWSAAYADLLHIKNKTAALLHSDEVSSQGNLFEAKIVAAMVWMLRHSVSAELEGRGTVVHSRPTPQQFWEKCVGVVTPHRAQRALIVRELEGLFPTEKNLIDEAVDTVERFQGGERHTIIVSFAVADMDIIGGEEAFIMQLERVNVAISRAMAKCIVVMPDTLAAYIPEDKRALATAFALKDYIEEFCGVRNDITFSLAGTSRNGQMRNR